MHAEEYLILRHVLFLLKLACSFESKKYHSPLFKFRIINFAAWWKNETYIPCTFLLKAKNIIVRCLNLGKFASRDFFTMLGCEHALASGKFELQIESSFRNLFVELFFRWRWKPSEGILRRCRNFRSVRLDRDGFSAFLHQLACSFKSKKYNSPLFKFRQVERICFAQNHVLRRQVQRSILFYGSYNWALIENETIYHFILTFQACCFESKKYNSPLFKFRQVANIPRK